MRIGINARLLASPDQRGFNRYTAELVRALAKRGVEIVLFSDRPINAVHRLEGLRAVVHPGKRQWRWQHRWLGGALERENIDLFHAPAHWGFPWRSKIPMVATIHDLASRELPHLFAGAPLRDRLRHGLEERLVVRKARRIITVSEFSADSIVRHLKVPREKITVTVEGAAPAFTTTAGERSAALVAFHRLRLPFFACVGGFDARKNLVVLVEALARLPESERFQIALIGSPGPAAHALLARASALGVRDWLHLAGSLPDAEVAALLCAAAAVVVPSTMEGFGLPVVEAMHVGTPAIVSSAGSLPEIAGNAALVCRPDHPDDFAEAMTKLARNPDLRRSLADRALARAPLFTWEIAAQQTMDVYESVIRDTR